MADSNFEYVDDEHLRQELLQFDENVGKITDKNRDILIKKINHLRARQRAAEAPPSPGRSPGRKKSTRAKRSTPPRRSVAPATPVLLFSSSDEDDSSPIKRENVAQRNLRRRTVDSSSMLNDIARTPGRSRGMATVSEPAAEAGKSKRRPVGGSPTSSSPAVTLSGLSRPGLKNGTRLQTGRVNEPMYEGEFSGSDDDYTFTEVSTVAVNTTPSLHITADTAASGGRRKQSAKTKQFTVGASGESWTVFHFMMLFCGHSGAV